MAEHPSSPAKPASARLAGPRKAHYTFARRNLDHITAVGVHGDNHKALILRLYLFLSPKRSSDAVAGSAEAKQALSLPSSIG
jgi:hypothetical protein